MLLAIDPSVRSPGAALFYRGKLIAAERVRVTKRKGTSDGARWLNVARDIVDWASAHCMYDTIDAVVFERPQWYAQSKSKGDPNDLAGLAGIGAAVAALVFSRHWSANVFSPTPREWIGQLPKATRGSAKDSPRANRILSRLDENEVKLVPNQHDAIDAVGIGLHCLGRLEPRLALSNGRDGR